MNTTIVNNNESLAHLLAIHESIHRKNTRAVSHALLRQLTDFYGKEPSLQDVTESFCRNFAKFLCSRVATNSARTYLHKLHAVLKKSVSCKFLESNPMPPTRELIPRTKIPQRAYLTGNEIVALERTPCRHQETKRAFLFACQTGLRLSDIETLRWDDIISVNGIPTIVKNQVKTGTEVRIPLNPIAQQLLECPMHSGLIFNMMSRSVILTDLRQWALDAGISKHLSFHVSRHTFATLSISAGVDIYVVSKLCGHASVKTTEIYAHMIDKTLIQGVNSLCSIIIDNRGETKHENNQRPTFSYDIRRIFAKLFKRKKTA